MESKKPFEPIPPKMQYTCSGCAKIKKEANHWYIVVQGCHGSTLSVYTWSDALANRRKHILLCGQLCLIKCVQYLTTPQNDLPLKEAPDSELELPGHSQSLRDEEFLSHKLVVKVCAADEEEARDHEALA